MTVDEKAVEVVLKATDTSIVRSDEGDPIAVYIQASVYTLPSEVHPEGIWLSSFSISQSITPDMLED